MKGGFSGDCRIFACFWCNLGVIAIAIPSGSISMDGAAVSASVRENDDARSAIATYTRAAEKRVSTETKEPP